MKKTNISLMYLGGVLLFVLGFFVGNISKTIPNRELSDFSSELRLGGKLTNPLLECEIAVSTITSRKEDFTPELEDFVEELKESTNISDIAVYFRDLNNGPVIGVNQQELYAPASLLKVPVMIAYLKWSEDEPDVLEERILYETPMDLGFTQEFAPLVPLEIGKTYSAKDLIENMVRYSDNQALLLLYNRLPSKYQEDLFRLVGIDVSLITDPKAVLSVRRYSIFFRILFNASFLSRTHSEYALKLLTETTFTGGIRAGVPEEITVAHKFGERKITNDIQQFHDCGVVYFPDHPYMLCIMTRGENPQELISAIKDISTFVYKEIERQYGQD
ncbi:MAG: class A beta-lactamase-related serine hydrolase [Candidatus Campbellbacteria bacterium]|nr:class A beta-lactamase-related serine hydrolase [Candidatus Campbellbacteria bacterium]